MSTRAADLLGALEQGTTATSVWAILGAIAAAGAVGGVINALLTDNGFVIPKVDKGILRPGVVGNVLLGAFAAVVSWGLYGPLKDAVLLGTAPAGEVTASLTVTALIGALLAGVGGARIITSEVDKRFLRTAATGAAARQPDVELAHMMATATPAQAALAAAPVD
ncbi:MULTISPECIES: hypothetical protein [unclassified Streptomyces]|uniref:hypothetical protein n=1 Tax=unclassified Streptomyces TaxID=2593676 RepID=UPI00225BD8DB|nr:MULTISPECIES: hypothetical protein [unclassified Streptomyces]MCX5052089.1 hypothetical protein [Streptomyces sp. NBC_00474]